MPTEGGVKSILTQCNAVRDISHDVNFNHVKAVCTWVNVVCHLTCLPAAFNHYEEVPIELWLIFLNWIWIETTLVIVSENPRYQTFSLLKHLEGLQGIKSSMEHGVCVLSCQPDHLSTVNQMVYCSLLHEYVFFLLKCQNARFSWITDQLLFGRQVINLIFERSESLCSLAAGDIRTEINYVSLPYVGFILHLALVRLISLVCACVWMYNCQCCILLSTVCAFTALKLLLEQLWFYNVISTTTYWQKWPTGDGCSYRKKTTSVQHLSHGSAYWKIS